MLHGWPGSIFEFYKVIGLLTSPADGKQGILQNLYNFVVADLQFVLAFHVVCPSLPGYGFSSPCQKPGMILIVSM